MSEELHLEIIDPSGQSDTHPVGEGPIVIGRSSEAHVQLESVRVSRRHAELSRSTDGGWIIRDLGSRNGTRVNGQPISEHTLAKGDRIEIGGFVLRLRGLRETDPQTTGWDLTGGDTTEFTMLRKATQPRLDAHHLQLVSGLGQQLLEIPEARQRMDQICQTLIDGQMRCDSAVILRMDRTTGSVLPQLLCSFAQRDATHAAPRIMRAAVEAAVANGQPVLVGGVISSGLTVEFDKQERGVTALIVCPIRQDEKQADLLYVTLPHECGTVDWLALVALVVEQYKKAELQIESRHHQADNAMMQHELQKARRIQMSLVPHHPTAAGMEIALGFEPCLWVGGDYVNVLTAPDGRVLLVIADVSGKGPPAAMVATGVHGVVHSEIRAGTSLSELARRLNETLLETLDLQCFVTMFLVLFDPKKGTGECVNAGHLPILIAAPDGKVTSHRCGHNPPLGIMPMSAEIESIELQPGQLMVLFTDGLSEMTDRSGKMLGVEGVEALVGRLYAADPRGSLDDLGKRLNTMLDELRGTPTATDDRTFLLARR